MRCSTAKRRPTSLALDRILAAEPALRAEYDELRRLFDGLSVVPKAFAPEGLVASVMAQIPQSDGRNQAGSANFFRGHV